MVAWTLWAPATRGLAALVGGGLPATCGGVDLVRPSWLGSKTEPMTETRDAHDEATGADVAPTTAGSAVTRPAGSGLLVWPIVLAVGVCVAADIISAIAMLVDDGVSRGSVGSVLSTLGDSSIWTFLSVYLAMPVLVLLGAISLRVGGIAPSSARRARRCLVALAAYELLVSPAQLAGYLLFESLFSVQIDDGGFVAMRSGLTVLRMVICLAALVGALGARPEPQRLSFDASGAPAGAEPDHRIAGTGAGRVRLAGTLRLLGVASAAGLGTGILVATFDAVDPGAAVVPSSGSSLWASVSAAFQALPLGGPGDLSFLVGPALLVLAVLLVGSAGLPRSDVARARRWITALAVLEFLVAAGSTASDFIPWPKSGASVAISQGGWCAIGLLACAAAIVGADGLRVAPPPRLLIPRWGGSAEQRVDVAGDTPTSSATLRVTVLLGCSVLASLMVGMALAIYWALNYSDGIQSVPGYQLPPLDWWANVANSLEWFAGASVGNLTFVVGPLLLLIGVLCLRSLRSRSGPASVVRRWFLWMAVVELAATAGNVLASVVPNPGLDVSGWDQLLGWNLVRAVICVAALVGAATAGREPAPSSTVVAPTPPLAAGPLLPEVMPLPS